MSSYADRLAALREQLKADKLDGFVVPLTDEHMSEYVGSYAQRLAWLTGFQGSAGSAVVLPEEAAIFVDGRYTLQVRSQVSADQWSYQSVPETSTTDWLKEHAPEGGRIGYDPWLHTRDWVTKAKEALASRGAELVAVARNPIDEVWTDRPEASKAHLVVQPDQYAGKSAAEKRTEIADWLTKQHADAAVLSALDSIAWAFNIRGADVTHTPGRAGLCAGQFRRHRRSVRRRREDRARRSPAPRQWRPPARARRVRECARRAQGQDGGRRPRTGGRRDLRRARKGRGQDPAAARPDDPAQGDQEPGRDCRTKGRSGARRRGDLALPALDRRGGARGRRRRAHCVGPSGIASPRESRASRPVVRQHLGCRAQRRDRPLQIEREDQPQARDRHALSDRFGRPICRRHHRHHPHRADRRADRGNARPLHPRAQGPYRDRHRGLPQGHARSAARQLRPPAVVGGGARLRPRHRPRRRQLPRGPRRAAAHFAGRQLADRAATSRCRRA